MKLSQFRLFSAPRKLSQALREGTYLVQRVGPAGPVCLYYLPDERRGFFVEVAYDAARCQARFLRSFRRTRRLVPYVAGLRLPTE